MAKINPANHFETETCTRCDGSGKYSYCQMYGDRCFRCQGAGRTYTKRGEAAYNYFTELRKKSTADLTIGEVIYFDAAGFGKSGWFTVSNLVISENGRYTITLANVKTGEVQTTLNNWGPENKHLVHQGEENMQVILAKAIDYQASLTKAGTVSKRKGSK